MEKIMNTDLDYYLLESDGAFMSPRLVVDDEVAPHGLDYLDEDQEVEEGTVSYLTLGYPIPSKPAMVDSLRVHCRAVFSKKIYDALIQHTIPNLQLVPAVIRGKKDEEYTDYWIANVYQEYAFLDPDKSERKGEIDEKGRWDMIKSMVLDEELVKKVPLEKRLVFYCRENTAYVMYHKSIVDIIMSVNPQGLVFVPVDQWYNG